MEIQQPWLQSTNPVHQSHQEEYKFGKKMKIDFGLKYYFEINMIIYYSTGNLNSVLCFCND